MYIMYIYTYIHQCKFTGCGLSRQPKGLSRQLWVGNQKRAESATKTSLSRQPKALSRQLWVGN